MEYLVGVPLFLCTLVEPLLLVGSEFNFYYSFNAVLAYNYWYTEADVAFAVLTVLRHAAGMLAAQAPGA